MRHHAIVSPTIKMALEGRNFFHGDILNCHGTNLKYPRDNFYGKRNGAYFLKDNKFLERINMKRAARGTGDVTCHFSTPAERIQ